MSFVYPSFLWAFLLLSIPIVLHFFHFQRKKTLYFSSLSFLRTLEKEKKNVRKIRNLLVLLLRIMAISCLVLAFSKPFINNTEIKGAEKEEVVVLYIDNSFSMTAKGKEGTLLSEARESARKIIKTLPKQTRVLLHTNKLDGIEGRLISREDAMKQLDKIKPFQLSRKLEDVFVWQKNVLDKEGVIATNIAYSDFQKSNLFIGSTDQFKTKRDCTPVHLLPEIKTNLIVDSVWFSSPIKKTGDNTEIKVRVKNEGEKKAEDITITLTVNNIKRTATLTIPPNKSETITFNYRESAPGFRSGKVEVSDNHLFWDDVFYFSYQIKKNTNVLIVNSEDSVNEVQKAYFLEPFYNVKSVSQGAFSKDQLKEVDLLLLNGVNEMSSFMSKTLFQFVRSNGCLMIFPGTKPKKKELNTFISNLQLPILGNTISNGTKIKKIEYKAPFFKGMFNQEENNLRLPSVSKCFKLIRSNKTRAYNLLTLQNGFPLFVQSSTNNQVFLFASSLKQEYSSFTQDALFPSILLRTGELSQKTPPLFLTLGKERGYPLYNMSNQENPIHLLKNEQDIIPKVIKQKSGLYSEISIYGTGFFELLEAGIYKITEEKIKKGQLALNYNRNESSMNFATKKEILSFFKKKNMNVTDYTNNSKKVIINNQKRSLQNLWKVFLLGALICFLLELLVLKFWKQ